MSALGIVIVLAIGGGAVAVAYFIFASFAFGAGYQPAPKAVVARMLELANVGPSDTLFDLGAGTGAIVFRAARERGARVIAVEVEPLRILVLRLRRWFGGPRDRVEIRWGDLYRVNFQTATVVTVFLWPPAMLKLKPIFERDLAPGSRVVSHWHPVEGWDAETTDNRLRVYLYRIPAAASGESGP
jgi:hypothetical protein